MLSVAFFMQPEEFEVTEDEGYSIICLNPRATLFQWGLREAAPIEKE
jgi:hypothetical protein